MDTGLSICGDRPWPRSNELEQSVLACLLLDWDGSYDVAKSTLGFEGAFYDPAHQRIFDVLTGDNAPKDVLALIDALESQGDLEQVGGRSYLNQLLMSTPTSAMVEDHCTRLQAYAIRRKLIQHSHNLACGAFADQADVGDLTSEAARELDAITGLKTGSNVQAVGDLILPAMEFLDKLAQGDHTALGHSTGFVDLDPYLMLAPEQFVVIAARPSMGKSALAGNLAVNLAMHRDEPVPVGVFSLEMSAQEWVLRMIASESRISTTDIRDGAVSPSAWQEVMTAGQRIRAAPIYIDDYSGHTIHDIRAEARRMVRAYGVQVVVIDYLQLVKGKLRKQDTRESLVAEISQGSKAMAKDLGVCVVGLAQLNRQAEEIPKLSHLRESGSIEQDADTVGLLHREREDLDLSTSGNVACEAELIIPKNRNGRTGRVPLCFFPGITRFQQRARAWDENIPGI